MRSPFSRSGAAAPDTSIGSGDMAAVRSNAAAVANSRVSCAGIGIGDEVIWGSSSLTTTSRSPSANGSGRSSTALTTLKMAVVDPIPNAIDSTATSVKPGDFRSSRRA